MKKDSTTYHADRLYRLTRIKRNGDMAIKGAEEPGSCRLQIVTKKFGEKSPPIPLILAHCGSQLVLSAEIKRFPTSVTSDGREIAIWLDDYSGGQIFCRKFLLNFFDEVSASAFFNIYSSFCVASCKKGNPSFYELQEKAGKEVLENMVGTNKTNARCKKNVNISDDDDGSNDEKEKENKKGDMEVNNKENEGDNGEKEYPGDHVDDFDDLVFSQDVFAQNCTIVHPFN